MNRKPIFCTILLFMFVFTFLMTPSVAANRGSVTARPGWGSGGRWRNTAPLVTIDSPANLATVEGIVLITVTATDAQDGVLTPTISIDGNVVAIASSYSWDTTIVNDGTHTIQATATDSGALSGSDTASVTVDNIVDPPPPPPPPGQNKYAIIVGISNYYVINDLTYCDEDATDWYNYLVNEDYEIRLFGDGTSSYPQWDGYATEYNVKVALAEYVALADEDDIIVFASSGHGTTYTGGQTICCWDYAAGQNGEDGSFKDVEMAAIFEPAASDVFIFLDHCYAGGMDEVMSNANAINIYLTTTCTDTGYGYDVPAYANGAWTYWFLEAGLVGQGFTTMEDCFVWSLANYPYGGASTPQEFDGNPTAYFTL